MIISRGRLVRIMDFAACRRDRGPVRISRGCLGKYGLVAVSIYNIVDRKEYRYRERRAVTPHILVARNLEPLYDIATAIKYLSASSSHGRCHVDNRGYGQMKRDSRRWSRLLVWMELDYGRVERSEMPELYHDADIMLNTSLVDNMPVSILEAFAGGACVTTDAGGIPYVVRHRENGMVAKMRDVEGLVRRCRRYSNDELR